MAKKKTITSKSVEQEEVAPEVVEQDEVAAVRTVAKKKGLSSFGSMLAAQNAKRKERKKLYGKEN